MKPKLDKTFGKYCQGVDLSVKLLYFVYFGQSVQESNQISIFYYFRVFLMYFW